MSKRRSRVRFVNAFLFVFASSAFPAASDLIIEIKDYATMPITGAKGTSNSESLLARINVLREEPGPSRKRFFVNDVNGALYILDKETKKLTTYLHFDGREGQPGIFHRLTIDNLLASGFISFQFDPDYVHNGRFYTI